MSLGQDDTMQGLGCGRGCAGAAGPRYQWVQGVDGLGNTIGYWQPTRPQVPNAPYARNAAPFFGEIAQAADGNLYQWVQGVDGLGSPFGFWKRIKSLKRLVKRAMPLVQKIAPFVPGGAAALTMATPFLKQAGVAGLGEVGALYAAPDGSLYQVQGVDGADGFAADDLNGLADDDLHGLAADDLDGFADDELRGLSDDDLHGLEADDELQGFGEGEDLRGFAAGDEFNGISAGPDRDGFAAMDPLDGIDADELNGFAAGTDLDGFAADEMNGFAADDLNGIDDDPNVSGYVRDGGVNGIEGYRPDRRPETPMFSPAPNAPMWAPLW